MLKGLAIRNLLIIEQLELNFQSGLNVLTGETGAGKSILLDALGFVLGWRGRADLVREGADQGEVQAWFELPAGHPAFAILKDAGLDADDELILRRQNTKDGRKTAWVNDRRCSGEVLRNLSDCLVELHGQHDDRGILNPRSHRQLLDDFGGLSQQVSDVKNAWHILSQIRQKLSEAEKALQKSKEEEEFLRYSLNELEQLNSQPGEEAELDKSRRLMQKSEKISTDISNAYAALGSDGASGKMGDAVRWLETVAPDAEGALDGPLAALSRAFNELDDATTRIEQCIQQLQFSTTDLEQTEERLFAIRALARKHNVGVDALAELQNTFAHQLTSIDQGDAAIKTLKTDLDQAQQQYQAGADILTQARVHAAKKLDQAMQQELAPLKMERAVFETQIEPTEPGPDGQDKVSFVVATNPGSPAGSLVKIASGGELSRFLLALKVCLAGSEQVTMIFDEIDRGVGGATADAVGRRLSGLAQAGQVLVVTHSPQVAACANHHWRVEKSVTDGETRSTVVPLDAHERVDEVARMLSGDQITDEARAAAAKLINT